MPIRRTGKTFSGFYWVFFPKNTEIAGQSTLEYLSSEAPHCDHNVLDQTKLAKQCVWVETKMEAIQHAANDEALAIKQLIRDIPIGGGRY